MHIIGSTANRYDRVLQTLILDAFPEYRKDIACPGNSGEISSDIAFPPVDTKQQSTVSLGHATKNDGGVAAPTADFEHPKARTGD
jgi:hypothetical protein